VFTSRPSGQVFQLEVLSTEQNAPAARAVLTAWLRNVTE
jgi:hypothetical protein